MIDTKGTQRTFHLIDLVANAGGCLASGKLPRSNKGKLAFALKVEAL
ncbi:hypothetical protein [Vibrio parahaemolyticus]